MKWSIYNIFIDNNDGNYILYNCRRDKVTIITSDLKKIIEQHIDNVFQLEFVHPELFQLLKTNGNIVDSKLSEGKDMMNEIDNSEKNSDCLSLIINPTMDCNLRCWYCYETHLKHSKMSEDILGRAKLLIKNRLKTKKYKKMELSFFGGEPLLEFDSVILPLISFSKEICDKHKVVFVISMTTNGLLLKDHVINKLLAFQSDMHFQIPFDGDRVFHNTTKNISSTTISVYDDVVANIKRLVDHKVKVMIRCNYSSENIHSFKTLIEEFKDISPNAKKFISIAFKRIWQASDNETIQEIIEDLCDFTNSAGIIDASLYETGGHSCYADTPSSVVVNYNGDVFKCTARDFLKESREGVLMPNGTIEFNERYQDRMECKKINQTCLSCRILPICRASCTQHHLELFEEDTCPIKLTEEKKEELVKKRIKVITQELS